MALDIDDEIRRAQDEHERRMALLHAVKQVASSPEAMAILAQMNGSVAKSAVEIPVSRSIGGEALGDDAEIDEPQKGSQIDAIRSMIAAWDGAFIVSELGDKLRSGGMNIENVRVGRVLQRLAKKYGEIKIVEKGLGGDPNTYVRTAKLRAPSASPQTSSA